MTRYLPDFKLTICNFMFKHEDNKYYIDNEQIMKDTLLDEFLLKQEFVNNSENILLMISTCKIKTIQIYVGIDIDTNEKILCLSFTGFIEREVRFRIICDLKVCINGNMNYMRGKLLHNDIFVLVPKRNANYYLKVIGCESIKSKNLYKYGDTVEQLVIEYGEKILSLQDENRQLKAALATSKMVMPEITDMISEYL